MNRTSTTEGSTSAEAWIAPPVEHLWMSVVFLQGEDADAVLDMIDCDGVDTAIRHLSQWDHGGETRNAALVNGYVYNEIPQSPTDRVVSDNASGYALTYNKHFGYVSLLRHFSPVSEERLIRPLTPPARLAPFRFASDRHGSPRRTPRHSL
jgi:hypothetical protein